MTFLPDIVSLCRRARTGRYHPFIWRHAPLPSEDESDMTIRYKSRGHHTAGFESLPEAEQECQKKAKAREAVLIEGLSEDDWKDDEVPATVIHVSRTVVS